MFSFSLFSYGIEGNLSKGTFIYKVVDVTPAYTFCASSKCKVQGTPCTKCVLKESTTKLYIVDLIMNHNKISRGMQRKSLSVFEIKIDLVRTPAISSVPKKLHYLAIRIFCQII